jgi:hypothetical protein
MVFALRTGALLRLRPSSRLCSSRIPDSHSTTRLTPTSP